MQHKKIGCLVIHGFGGSTYEVEPLAIHLAEKGYDAVCPILKGHTGKREDMKNANYLQWIYSVEEELIKLQTNCDDIYIIGFSMGGLIAFNLAERYEIKAIVTINTPIYYWNIKRILTNLIEDLRERDLKNFKRYMKSSRNSPFSALRNFLLLLKLTKSKLKLIKCPVYIIQALDDDTVRKASASFIFDNLSSPIKCIRFYENGGHLILRSQIAEQVINDIEIFLKG